MNFDLSDEQRMLAEQVRGLVAERSGHDALRKLIDDGAEWDRPLWDELGQMGFLGAAIAEEHGGLGLSDLDMGVVSEELGRANAALPFFSSIILATGAIEAAGSEEQKAAWLPRIASGECVATFAYAEGSADPLSDGMALRFAKGRLNGRKGPAADAGIAQIAIVLARGDNGPILAMVDLNAAGVTRQKLSSFDQLRAHYDLVFDDVPAEVLPATDVPAILARLFDRAAVQAAFEAVGGAEACLHMARDYAMERRIFGRPLGSYQAIKHKLADIVTAVELARSSAYYAAWAATSDLSQLPAAAAAARLMATSAFENAARENIQVHGGIGYTFEANCHFYYRRERTLALSLGSREAWADRLIASLPATPPRKEAA